MTTIYWFLLVGCKDALHFSWYTFSLLAASQPYQGYSYLVDQPRLDQAVPFSTTPNHRIMVPSDGDDATVKAIDLKLGSWVMCSDGMAKKVIGMKLIHAARSQELLYCR